MYNIFVPCFISFSNPSFFLHLVFVLIVLYLFSLFLLNLFQTFAIFMQVPNSIDYCSSFFLAIYNLAFVLSAYHDWSVLFPSRLVIELTIPILLQISSVLNVSLFVTQRHFRMYFSLMVLIVFLIVFFLTLIHVLFNFFFGTCFIFLYLK